MKNPNSSPGYLALATCIVDTTLICSDSSNKPINICGTLPSCMNTTSSVDICASSGTGTVALTQPFSTISIVCASVFPILGIFALLSIYYLRRRLARPANPMTVLQNMKLSGFVSRPVQSVQMASSTQLFSNFVPGGSIMYPPPLGLPPPSRTLFNQYNP